MKVNNKPVQQPLVHNKNIGQANSANAKAKDKLSVNNKQQMSDAAKVNLSSRAKDINKAMEIAKQTKTDEAKLDRLQKMIDKGEYKVEADKVADSLINEHLIFRS